MVYRLPDSISFEEAAMLEAVSVAIHAVSLAQVSPNSTALVVGAGMVGLLIVQVLRAARCSRIFVANIDNFHFAAPFLAKCAQRNCLNSRVQSTLKWLDFDRCITMKTNVLCGSPVAQR